VSYGPQPGHYPPPPGYGPYRPPGPNNAYAYVSAGLFLIGGMLALIAAIVGWDGQSENPDVAMAMVGLAFSDDLTGNVDAAVAITISVACTAILFALLLFARLDLVRWLLGFVGGLVTVYYLYAIIKLLADDLAEFIAMVIVSFLVWTAATVVVLLPQTGHAMRGYQRKLAQYGYGQPAPPGYRPY
jgi:hypothetical protein